MSLTQTPLAHPLSRPTPTNSIDITFDGGGGSDRTVTYDVRPHLASLLGSMMKVEEITLVARDLPREDEDTLTLKVGGSPPSTSDRCIIAASPGAPRREREMQDLAPTSLMLDTVPDAFVPESLEVDDVSTMRLSSTENPALAFCTASHAARTERRTEPSMRRKAAARSATYVVIAMVAVSLGAGLASPKLRAKAARSEEIVRFLRGNGRAQR